MTIRKVIALQECYIDSQLRRQDEEFTIDDEKNTADGFVIALVPEPEPEPVKGKGK